MKYKAYNNPVWKHRKTGHKVSFRGSLPHPAESYELIHQPTIEVTNGRGQTTFSNYFFGKVITDINEAINVAERLNTQWQERSASK